MCLSLPVKILKIENKKAIVDFHGEEKEFGVDLVQDIEIGDYALASNSFLIKKISAEEAQEIFNIIKPTKGKEEK